MATSDKFLSVLKEIIREEINKTDQTVLCKVQSNNSDGTVNVFILPDLTTIVYNIINASKYELIEGDIVILYKIKNQINNSFIIAKYRP